MMDEKYAGTTPRTDAFLENALSAIHETETIEDFTRQLERDFAAERERADRNQEDAERLDWVEKNACVIQNGEPLPWKPFIREQIDAARRK